MRGTELLLAWIPRPINLTPLISHDRKLRRLIVADFLAASVKLSEAKYYYEISSISWNRGIK